MTTAVTIHPTREESQHSEVHVWMNDDTDRLMLRVEIAGAGGRYDGYWPNTTTIVPHYDESVFDLIDNLRTIADHIEVAVNDWIDRNGTSWGRNDDGTYRCCGGYGEHFDICEVGQHIARARRFTTHRALDAGADLDAEAAEPGYEHDSERPLQVQS